MSKSADAGRANLARQDKNYPAGPRAAHARLSVGGITPKQERFCEEYTKSLNINKAYVDAGYEPTSARSNAFRLFNKPHIQVRIKELLDERRRANLATVSWVMSKLQIIAEEAYDTSEYHAAISALKLLGLQLGMFSKVQEAASGVPLPKTDDAMDAELGRLIKLATKDGKAA